MRIWAWHPFLTVRLDGTKGAQDALPTAGESRANALMRCTTKGKRRVTLSICGLGFPSEDDLDGMPGVQTFDPDEDEPPDTKLSPRDRSAPLRRNVSRISSVSLCPVGVRLIMGINWQMDSLLANSGAPGSRQRRLCARRLAPLRCTRLYAGNPQGLRISWRGVPYG